MSDERAIAQMDANLLLAGLIAVQVHITNSGSSAIAAGALHASLRSPSDKTLAPIAPKKALQRVMKYYGTRLYGLEAYASHNRVLRVGGAAPGTEPSAFRINQRCAVL
jgi:hypothetical protein